MIPVTDAYLAAIRAPVRTDSVHGSLRLQGGAEYQLTAADLMSGTLTIDEQCVTGEELQFGCVYLGQAAFTLKTALDRYTLYGAVVTLFYDIQLSGTEWYTVPLGVYNIAEAERTGGAVAIKAYDNALLLDAPFDGEALQGTPYEMLCQIAARCGLAMGQSEAELGVLCNSGESFQLAAGADGCDTYRDCVAAIAQVLAGFGTVDRSGALVIRRFATTPCTALAPDARCKTTVADYLCRYDSLLVEADSAAYTAERDPPCGGLQMTIEDAPLLNKGLAERNTALVQAMFDTLNGIEYVPATVTMPGDPALECGDMIALPQLAAGGGSANTLITHRVWKYHARQTIRGAGRNPRLAAAQQKTSAAVRRLQAETEQNKLIFYSFTNQTALTLADGGKEVGIARIMFTTVADTSAMFLAQLLLTAKPEADAAPVTLTLKYYLDGLQVADYLPQQTLAAGAHTVALFYPFALLAANTAHTLELRGEAAGGTVSLAAGAVRATVTGQGMAGEDEWDGTITVEDTAPGMAIACAAIAAATPREQLQAALALPLPCTAAEQLAAMRWAPTAIMVGSPGDEAVTETE